MTKSKLLASVFVLLLAVPASGQFNCAKTLGGLDGKGKISELVEKFETLKEWLKRGPYVTKKMHPESLSVKTFRMKEGFAPDAFVAEYIKHLIPNNEAYVADLLTGPKALAKMEDYFSLKHARYADTDFGAGSVNALVAGRYSRFADDILPLISSEERVNARFVALEQPLSVEFVGHDLSAEEYTKANPAGVNFLWGGLWSKLLSAEDAPVWIRARMKDRPKGQTAFIRSKAFPSLFFHFAKGGEVIVVEFDPYRETSVGNFDLSTLLTFHDRLEKTPAAWIKPAEVGETTFRFRSVGESH